MVESVQTDLKRRYEAAGLNTRDLGAKVGLKSGTLRSKLNGFAPLRRDELVRIEEAIRAHEEVLGLETYQ